LVAEERLEDDRAVLARGADDPELELPLRDHVDDGLRVEDRQGDRRLRRLLGKLADHLWHDRPARAGRGAELEPAPDRGLLLGRELLEELLLDREETLRAAIEALTCLGGLDTA